MRTLANVYQLRDNDDTTFFRVLEADSKDPWGNKGEKATMSEIEARLYALYPDVQFVPELTFSIEVLRREEQS